MLKKYARQFWNLNISGRWHFAFLLRTQTWKVGALKKKTFRVFFKKTKDKKIFWTKNYCCLGRRQKIVREKTKQPKKRLLLSDNASERLLGVSFMKFLLQKQTWNWAHEWKQEIFTIRRRTITFKTSVTQFEASIKSLCFNNCTSNIQF